MKPDLVGYVLNALDAESHAAVEAHLCTDPEAQAEVQVLRRAVSTLSSDANIPPPPGLADRTIAQVAALEALPQLRPLQSSHGIPWRRLAEAAAVLLIVVTAAGIGISWIGRLNIQRPGGEPNAIQVVACKDNLHKVFHSLRAYADTHGRQFPSSIPADLNVACPAGSGAVNQSGPPKIPQTYAYSIGYNQGGQVIGPRLDDDKPSSLIPLMADSSPLDPLRQGPSQTHGGTGQNVLYSDGHVTFCHSRFVGVNQDDIYLNRAKQVAPGLDWRDAVLTSVVAPP